MSVMATFAPETAQSMCSQAVHLLSAMSAKVRPAQKGTQAKACDPLMVLSSMCKPSIEIGRTFSRAPDSLAKEASRRVHDLRSGAVSNKDSASADALSSSQDICQCCSPSLGGTRSCPIDQLAKALLLWGSGKPWVRGGTMQWTRSMEAVVEDKYADGTRSAALQMPSPPSRTGRVAWLHAESSFSK